VQAIDLCREPYETEIKEAMEYQSSDSSDDEDLYDCLKELEAYQSWSTKKLSSIEKIVQAIHKVLCIETGKTSVENLHR
jgi:hypothetical protein